MKMQLFALLFTLASPIFATHLLPGAPPAPSSPRDLPFSEIKKGRIVNGDPAYKGEFPWQAALYLTMSDGTYFCSGALIAPRWILTAAHCLEGVSGITATLGVVYLSDVSGVSVEASRIVVHPQYSSTTRDNDVALIQLSTAVEASATIRSIPLGGTVLNATHEVTVSGWGATDDSGNIIDSLRYVHLTTIENDICAQSYGTTIQSTIVCANGNNGESACSGDNGGPLVTDLGTNPVHVGIVSFGHSAGCTKGYPTAYTRTEAYTEWIIANAIA